MSPRLPITYCLFTSTKGHWGTKDLYRTTLDHLDRRTPLCTFNERIAHVKVTPSEEAIADAMEATLRAYGFHVLRTVARWSRGTAHQHGIVQDQRTVSLDAALHASSFMVIAEDDSPWECHKTTTTDCLAHSCQMLADNHELVSVRTLRREDLSTSPMISVPNEDPRWFYSPHWNLQPGVLRVRDFYVGCNLIEQNWTQVSHLQVELLWRLVMTSFSRSDRRHLVYRPDYAETYHVGTEDWRARVATLT